MYVDKPADFLLRVVSQFFANGHDVRSFIADYPVTAGPHPETADVATFLTGIQTELSISESDNEPLARYRALGACILLGTKLGYNLQPNSADWGKLGISYADFRQRALHSVVSGILQAERKTIHPSRITESVLHMAREEFSMWENFYRAIEKNNASFYDALGVEKEGHNSRLLARLMDSGNGHLPAIHKAVDLFNISIHTLRAVFAKLSPEQQEKLYQKDRSCSAGFNNSANWNIQRSLVFKADSEWMLARLAQRFKPGTHVYSINSIAN